MLWIKQSPHGETVHGFFFVWMTKLNRRLSVEAGTIELGKKKRTAPWIPVHLPSVARLAATSPRKNSPAITPMKVSDGDVMCGE
jgi:hypothetical protein